jgi:hypothetical protein
MAVDLAREMHLASVRRRLDREVAASAWAWEGHWPILVDWYQAKLQQAARKYDQRLTEAEQQRANKRAWRREHSEWTPELKAAIRAAIDAEEAAANAAANS